MAVNRGNYGDRPNRAMDQLNAQLGKLPPQAIEVEKAVLGALMLERDAFINVADILSEDSFYDTSHQKIFKVIKSLNGNDKPIDLMMVTQLLKDRDELEDIGGPVYISELTSMVASAAHIEFHARIIAQKFIQRELIRVSSEIQTKSYDDTIELEDLIDGAEQSLFGVTEGNIKKDIVPIKPVIAEALIKMKESSLRDGLSGAPSGFIRLDAMTHGWHNTDLVICAARPAMGKTAFVLSMARNMAVDNNVAVAFFSLEMSSLQLVNRLIASESKLGGDKIKSGKLEEYEWDQLRSSLTQLNDAPLFIDDTPALSVYEFRAKCRRLKSQHDIGCVIVDYLQLMTVGGDARFSREQEVSTISRNLKAIAKEIDVPIIALSQLSRAVESREGRKPQLSDLRESGAIEQDADLVMFLHRPDYYGINEVPNGDGNDMIPAEGLAEVIIAKHRSGATGEVYLRFEKDYAKFSNLEDREIDDYSTVIESIATGDEIATGDKAPPGAEDLDIFSSSVPRGSGFDNE